MFEGLRKILGVPRGELAASSPQPAEYLPESALGEREIHAAAAIGEQWVPWRVDADGEQWLRKVSASGAAAAIHGVPVDDELTAEDDDDGITPVFDDDDEGDDDDE